MDGAVPEPPEEVQEEPEDLETTQIQPGGKPRCRSYIQIKRHTMPEPYTNTLLYLYI